MNIEPTEWEEIFASCIDRGLLSRKQTTKLKNIYSH